MAEEIHVVASDERGDVSAEIDMQHLVDLARVVLETEGITKGELGLRFVESNEMTRLNQQHMGENCPTDVLAFPLDGNPLHHPDCPAHHAVPSANPGDVLIGDVVVCPNYAAAATNNLDQELELLVVHGVLHVLGYDHHTDLDAQLMRTREQQLLASCHKSERHD